MTMLQPTCVLPSNAPPLQDGSDGGLQHNTRVLQEHSGNRQPQHSNHDFGSSTGDWDTPKYPQYTQPKYAWMPGAPTPLQHQQQQHQHSHLYHPQPQHRHAYRYASGGRSPYVNEAKLQYDAERLYRRFRQSDQYVKYRTRQSKDDKGNGDQKWPDHLEKAFFRALITYPPMGRRKHLHKEKQRGRNELIADCIEELTGEARTRKQVSSHIQVLKPFVENDPQIMKWLSKEDMMAQGGGRYHGHSYPTGRRMMSNYPVTAPPSSMRSSVPSLPRTDSYGVQQLKQSPQAFEPADFQMFIQRKHQGPGSEEKIDRLHTYSQAISHPLAEDHPMSDWQALARDFPLLADANAQRPLDCTVLIAEASLAFPTEPMDRWKDRESASIELGIYFQCRSCQLPAPRPGMKSPVTLLNKFYVDGQEVETSRERTELYFHTIPGAGSTVETEIKFGSQFWARELSGVGRRLSDPSQLTQQDRDKAASSVRSLAALQEVFIAAERGQERIAVVHWSFRLSNHNRGRTSWRRLLLPDPSAITGIYTAPPTLKPERADSFYDHTSGLGDLGGSQQQPQPPLPALQSPFEYDTGSSGGSALSSATWPSGTTSLSDAPIACDFTADNAFDFNAGNINIAYDPTLNFDGFDSSAFNFDDPGAVNVDFAADPDLHDFSQQATWYDGAFDAAQTDDGGSFGAVQTEFVDDPAAAQMYASYDAQYDGQAVAEYLAPEGQQHAQSLEHQQAYGGARPELIKEEDALAALADASAWARGLGAKSDAGGSF